MNRAAVLLSVLVLFVLSVVPVARTLMESVVERRADGTTAGLTLRHYDEALVHGPAPAAAEVSASITPATRPISARWRMLGNSVVIAGLAALFALLLGVPYALLVARTDAPGRGILGTLYVAPLVLPPLLVSVSWMFIPGFEPAPKTVAEHASAWGGVIAALRAAGLFALCYFPLVVLFARRALARVPASLEESARLAGGTWRTLLRVTLPIASPGILAGALFVFLFALNDFSLVDYLNWVRPLSDQISVYPFESFTAWSKSQGEPVATALGLPLALLGVGLLYAIQRLVGRDVRASVTGDFRPAAPWRLGAWRWPAVTVAALLLAVAAALPIVGIAMKAGGLDRYRDVWQQRVGPSTSSNEVMWTLWFCVGAAVLSLPLAFVLGHHAARTRRMTWLALAILPLALPPIFLGAGYLKLLNLPGFTVGGRNPFLDQDGPRLGSMLLLVAKYAPFAIVAAWAAFLEIDPKLEEAAATAGVKPLDRALGILAPLAKPALGLGFVLVFVLSLREIDTIVLLSSDTIMRRMYTMVHYQRDAEVAALCVILVALEAIPFAVLALLKPKSA
jgi:iron(III) transport system permease protein